MKLNANPDSRHFWLQYGRPRVDCYLDGARIFNVYEADDAEGYAVVYVVENSRQVDDPKTGKPALKWLRGKIEFRPQK